MTDDFRGSYTVTVTPFTPDGSAIDVDALRGFLDWQLAEGVPGLVLLGTTGEFNSITAAERTTLVEAAVDHVAGRVPVLVGTTAVHTPEAARQAREAQALGADGLMAAPPFYVTPTHDEIAAHYAAICDACDLPVMLYNNPFTTNVDMPAALVARLTRDLEQVRYIKEASTDVARVFDIVEATEGAMRVFAGERIVESHLLGAVGYINPFGNYTPRPSRVIWDLLEDGRVEDAKRLQRLLNEIDETIAEGHPLYGHQCWSKALAAAAGHPVGDVRPPLTTYASLGEEGPRRVGELRSIIARLDELTAELEPAPASA